MFYLISISKTKQFLSFSADNTISSGVRNVDDESINKEGEDIEVVGVVIVFF